MRRVLITAAASPLPSAVARRLVARPDVDAVVVVDIEQPDPVPDAEAIALGSSYRQLRDVIGDHEIDTVVHGAASPDGLGERPRGRAADVIATMQVAAVAANLAGPVRNLLALSSTARYRAGPGAPQFRHEHEELGPPPEGTSAASLAEAEDYLVALADQRPNLAIGILRLADLVGPGVSSPLAALLQRATAPRYVGFDPPVQFLHVDDALDAIDHALERELAGTFNIASRGSIRWGGAIRLRGGTPVLLLPPELDPFVRVRRSLRLDLVPAGLSRVLRFGRVASTERVEATGYVAAHSVDDCLRAIRASGRMIKAVR